MYIPEHFREADDEVLRQFIAANSFGLLVTNAAGEINASHLPMLLDGGKLIGHLAKANGQTQDLKPDSRAVAIFSGPHAYISPSLYSTPESSVPTWNYTAVHVHGTLSVLSEPSQVVDLLRRMVDVYESSRQNPWGFDPEAEYIRKATRAIVAFEMKIERIEGKFKLSQNRSIGDRGRVMWSLKDSESQNDRDLAKWMEKLF